jgi:tetratricopeptide (TPR) repeat protein
MPSFNIPFRMKFLFFCISSFSTIAAMANPFISNDSVAYYVQKGKEYKEARKIFDAEKAFLKAIQFDPTDDKARLALADYYVEYRKYFQAVEQYGKILEKNINHPVALEKMTDLSFQLRRWNDVLLYGTKMQQNNLKSEKLNFMFGKVNYEQENYGMAQKYLQEVVAVNPKHTEAVTLLGKVFVDLGNYPQAMNVYSKSIQLDPNNYDLIYEYGLLLFAMDKEKEAVKYFEEAVAKGLKPDLGYKENLGMAYLSFDLKKGVELLNEILKMKPGNAQILNQVGHAYYKAEKYNEAYASYYKIYEVDPSNGKALYMAGVVLQKKGGNDKGKGIAMCEQAISMNPELAQLKTQKSMF